MNGITNRLIFSLVLLLIIGSQSYAQEDPIGDEATDSVLSEKLKTIQTMEQLLDSVRLDGRQTGAINDRREQKFLDARDQQQALLDRAMARLDRENKKR